MLIQNNFSFNLNIFFFFNNYFIFYFFNFVYKNFYIYFYILLKIKKTYSSVKLKYKLNFFDFKNKIYSNLQNDNFLLKKTYFFYIFNFLKKKKKIKFFEIKKFYFSNIKNRQLYKLFFVNKNINTKKITKKLNILNKTKNHFFLKKIIFSLKYILLINHMLLSKNDLFFFLKKKIVFLNRLNINNPNKILKQNDIIEFIYFKFFFVYLLKISKILFYKNFFFFKFKQKWLNLKKNNKKNNFIIENKYFNYFLIKNFEISFLNLSIVLINENINFLFLDWKIKNFLLFFFFSIYNWKFIN